MSHTLQCFTLEPAFCLLPRNKSQLCVTIGKLRNARWRAAEVATITLEDPVTDPTFGTELGRNDLRIYPQNHRGQTVFFVVECKRLQVTSDSGFKHLADKYVVDGMQRFVDGRYASNLPCGGMLGYVMDNRLDDAFARVQGEIEARRVKLGIKTKECLRTPSSTLPHYRWSADSFHDRADDKLCIHHLLVGASADVSKQVTRH